MVTQRSYLAAVELVRTRLLGFTSRVWSGLGSYRDADIDRLVAIVVPQVQAGQVAVANLTEAYFRQIGAQAAVNVAAVTGGRGVPAAEVYRRPAVTTYTALSEGKPLTVAVAEGGRRLASLISTDLQMAKVRQSQRSLTSVGLKAYMRVLTGKENCALCVIASTQRYWVEDLLPVHPGCDCGVDRIPPGWDPSEQVLDPDLLESIHRLADEAGEGNRAAIGYQDLIVTREHGEYGPTLTWRTDHFTSAADIATN